MLPQIQRRREYICLTLLGGRDHLSLRAASVAALSLSSPMEILVGWYNPTEPDVVDPSSGLDDCGEHGITAASSLLFLGQVPQNVWCTT
jgi:hypothetical protein